MPPAGFGLLPVRSPLLRESSLFLGVLRCFSSPGALFGIAPKVPGRAPGGLPHSEIPGSLAASASPGHFAAWPRPSSAANAKASTMRPSCGFLHLFPSGVCRGRDSRPARASGMVPSAAAPPRCPACAVPRWVVCVFLCSMFYVALQCARATRHEHPSPTKTGAAQDSDRAMPTRAIAVSRGRRTRRVPRGALSRCRRLISRRSDDPAVVVRSSNLVRSRLPTSDEGSQPAGGPPDRGWPAGTTTGVKHPGWSRGDSNPGPPPCKGGALPAKLRPPVPSAPAPAWRGGRAWTRTRDLGLIRAAL
jgi:hypothetical protein